MCKRASQKAQYQSLDGLCNKSNGGVELKKDTTVKGSRGWTVYSYVGVKSCERGLRKFDILKYGQCGIEESTHVEMIQILTNET